MYRSRVRAGSTALLMAITFISFCGQAADAPDTRPPVPCRDYIVKRIADLRKISTPEGIEILEKVAIGRSQQWISIRGLNVANPVLLMIHGGPGSPIMGASWAFQKPWEDFFTVVQWDQRGVGKNRAGTDLDALGKTMTVERMINDAEEMVAYLRKRLKKDKIVVLGFSWGTLIGAQVAYRHPDWVHAYVGVGQAGRKGAEKYIYDRVWELAEADRNAQALEDLRSIAPYPLANDPEPIRKALLLRKWARVYNGGWYGKPDFDLYFSLPDWAPEYSQQDVDGLFPGLSWSERQLEQDFMGRDIDRAPLEFKVPIVFLMGRHDLHTPYEPARSYFEQIRAPHKKLVTFERSAHFPMFEEPGRFLIALVNEVLPLTVGSGKVTPPTKSAVRAEPTACAP